MVVPETRRLSVQNVVESRRRWGKRIVRRLAHHRALGPGFVGAPSRWRDEGDVRMVADAGAATNATAAAAARERGIKTRMFMLLWVGVWGKGKSGQPRVAPKAQSGPAPESDYYG